MSEIDKKYENLEAMLKATFFDTIFRNQAVLTSAKAYDNEEIRELVEQQNKSVNKALGLLSALVRTVNEVNEKGNKISNLIMENSLVESGIEFEDNFATDGIKNDVTVSETGNPSEQVVGDSVESPVVTEDVVESQNDETPVVTVSEEPKVVADVPTEAVPITPIEEKPVEEAVNPINAVIDEVVAQDVVIPGNEVVNVTPTTEPVDASGLVLSPIEEAASVVPEQTVPEVNQEASVIPEGQEVASDEQKEISKFIRSSQQPAKAILVTGSQMGKLAASKNVQKEVLSGVNQKVNSQVQEQTTVDSQVPSNPQQQMQQLMEQANALYKEGKAEDAQALMNQVSEMSKTLQTGSAEQTNGGVAFVKAS